jgi:hypothetical protein
VIHVSVLVGLTTHEGYASSINSNRVGAVRNKFSGKVIATSAEVVDILEFTGKGGRIMSFSLEIVVCAWNIMQIPFAPKKLHDS